MAEQFLSQNVFDVVEEMILTGLQGNSCAALYYSFLSVVEKATES